MRSLSKILAFPLIAALTVSCLADQALSPRASAAPPAGCHEHGGNVPQPKPAKYQCCLTGHDVAVPQPSDLHPPVIQVSISGTQDESPVQATVSHREEITPSSEHPPGILPLRI